MRSPGNFFNAEHFSSPQVTQEIFSIYYEKTLSQFLLTYKMKIP